MTENLHTALLIAVMSLVTIALRALPFGIFGSNRSVPKTVLYLGEVLPSAALGMLVIYCLREVNLSSPSYGLETLLACSAVVLVQVIKRNSIVSILSGTILYMLLLHL